VPHNRQVSDDVGTELPDPEFPAATWGREGYSASEVDEFLRQLKRALRREPPTMAPYEVVDQRFKVTRFGRRYGLREVDEYLESGRELLHERHGEDAVANLEAQEPEPRHFPTLWIYLVALVLVAVMLAFLLTQL
jgi:DivIVA domain-containing protein